MSTRLLIEQLLNGFVIGAMYALMASGLSLIWGSLKMLNFAHGEFYMLGGYIVYFFSVVVRFPAILAIPLSLVVVMIVGVLVERLLITPLIDKPGFENNAIIITVGISIFLQNFALRMWGERFKNIPYYVNGTLIISGIIRLAKQRVFIFIVALIVIWIGTILMQHTKLGLSIRATAQDRDTASLMGVNVRTVYMWTVTISVMLAALAAAMLSPIFSVNPWMGQALLLKAFVVCVLGGLGNLKGAILGGIVLGIIESLTVIFWSSEWQDVISLLVLILVLWIRPSGLLGTKEW